MKKWLIVLGVTTILVVSMMGVHRYVYRHEYYFYKELSEQSRLEKPFIFLKDVTDFEWDYVCAIHSYEVYDRFKIEDSLGFKYQGEIPDGYGTSEYEVLLVFLSKDSKTVIQKMDASNLIYSDKTRRICNKKENLKLLKGDPIPYEKASYEFSYQFILSH
jgi:hypothetical protein